MRTTIAQSRDEARKAAYHAAGILDVGSMTKESLVGYCRQHSLNVSGSLASLRSRVSTHVQGMVASGDLNVLGSIPAGEFDWVVSQSGGLHWEMNLIQAIVKTLWPFVYKEFCFSQGYTSSSPHQLDWAHKAKDHHRTYDELSRFTESDGCMDELLRRYVVSCASDCAPTAEGFFEWAKKFEKNKVFSWLLELVTTYCFTLFMLRRGARHCDVPLFLAARRTISPLLYARNHTTYQLIDMFEEQQRLAMPEDLRCELDKHNVLVTIGQRRLPPSPGRYCGRAKCQH
eukprot:scpid18005/ scgid3777/ 